MATEHAQRKYKLPNFYQDGRTAPLNDLSTSSGLDFHCCSFVYVMLLFIALLFSIQKMKFLCFWPIPDLFFKEKSY